MIRYSVRVGDPECAAALSQDALPSFVSIPCLTQYCHTPIRVPILLLLYYCAILLCVTVVRQRSGARGASGRRAEGTDDVIDDV